MLIVPRTCSAVKVREAAPMASATERRVTVMNPKQVQYDVAVARAAGQAAEAFDA